MEKRFTAVIIILCFVMLSCSDSPEKPETTTQTDTAREKTVITAEKKEQAENTQKKDAVPVSDATLDCISCHESIHPGIVEDWKNSNHAVVTPAQALQRKELSGKNISENFLKCSVGCAECHTMRTKAHADTFYHNGYDVHVVVSPDDCATCHQQEAKQYALNLMSFAHKNLEDNLLYQDLQRNILGDPVTKNGKVYFDPANTATSEEACLYCHGTCLEVKGTEVRETMLGEMEFPVLSGWPNQGVGRVNLDGSRGSCTACHTRHQFSIEMARKPYTCKECHVGPDVPASKVYASSKHGNIFSAMQHKWDFSAEPWTIGKDFSAPTCAACHISKLISTDGMVVAERTHRMSDRIPWRIFGLIYAHPHPKEPDTTQIRNQQNYPLPTDLDGGFAEDFLISKEEMEKRKTTMQGICLSCHDTSWVDGHWSRFENAIAKTNDQTKFATQILMEIWEKGYAGGIPTGESPWDEAVEKKWTDIWLLYANTTRFASAMGGGGDYGVYSDGRYHLTKRIMEMQDWLEMRKRIDTR
jgi:hypothetical protein